ncbi:hypothetical protein EVAR_61381_1 [Eumeta japonica]|uniref:Uncharacterized protein n=1 Tax=Eumeta variegata TaxID=151549 RepID=A0A4C1ZC36_EUMVA|nr:hypothetical protein EVAR_61381_1 [Eumeta japonica]
MVRVHEDDVMPTVVKKERAKKKAPGTCDTACEFSILLELNAAPRQSILLCLPPCQLFEVVGSESDAKMVSSNLNCRSKLDELFLFEICLLTNYRGGTSSSVPDEAALLCRTHHDHTLTRPERARAMRDRR